MSYFRHMRCSARCALILCNLVFDAQARDIVKMFGVAGDKIKIMLNLDLNYDLYSMSGYEILEILPGDFDKWKERMSEV